MNLKGILVLISMFGAMFAQNTVSGTVKDAASGEKLYGANVFVKGTTIGAAADVDGEYSFTVNSGEIRIVASYVGYVDGEKKVRVTGDTEVNFELKSDIFSREVTVTAQRAEARKTPVPFAAVTAAEIEQEVGNQDITAALKNVPGVYATEEGGGSGDSNIRIRGFSVENIAVMVNGVPVNDMENGFVYWSNWSGLTEVTSSIQVQRGLGASKLSTSSIGGTVNLITKATDSEAKSKVAYSTDDFNTKKMLVSYSTGLLENDIALSMMFSRKTSDGYVNNTWTEDFTYFLSVGKLFGTEHSLNLNIVGTPQRHGQRTNRSTIAVYKQKGYDWNPDWGYVDGNKRFTLRENFYHKPVFDLNWVWQMDEKTSLTTVAYASYGTGGGTGERPNDYYQPDGNRVRSFSFMKIDPVSNQLDVQSIYDTNRAGGDANGGAINILRASNNNHSWFGLVSTYDKQVGNLNYTVGVDGRYYIGEHYRTVEDLMGGDYYLDDDNKNIRNYYIDGSGDSARLRYTTTIESMKRYVDDTHDYNNDGVVRQFGLFTTVEGEFDNITAYANLAMDSKGMKRIDYFSYLSDKNLKKVRALYNQLNDAAKANTSNSSILTEQESDWENHVGYQIKAGVNVNLDDNNNVYTNLGYISKVPSFDAVFINFSNTVNEDVENEKIFSVDLGYGYRSKTFALNFNGYYTSWKDRFYSTSQEVNSIDYNFDAYSGVEQTHFGAELDFRYKPTNYLDIEGSVSHQYNVYADDFDITGYADDQPDIVGTLSAKDTFIPNQPQTTASLALRYSNTTENGNTFYVRPKGRFSARHFAGFDLLDRFYIDGVSEYTGNVNGWEIPDYYVFDLSAGYTFNGSDDSWYKSIGVNMNIYNFLNKAYIVSATNNGSSFLGYTDGRDVHAEFGENDAKSAFVYFGRPRYTSIGFTINF